MMLFDIIKNNNKTVEKRELLDKSLNYETVKSEKFQKAYFKISLKQDKGTNIKKVKGSKI